MVDIMKKKLKFIGDLSMFSRYRTELMGYAIWGVLIIHFSIFTNHPISIIDFISRLVYTQGFLFLSGFGLYYSYSKNQNIISFYRKRINRLYVPWILISFVFLVASVLRHKEGVCDFISYITTIAFWYKGNYYGVWYVAVSLLLYFLYPFIHRFLFIKNKKPNILLRVGGVIIGMCLPIAIMYFMFPYEWELIGGWIIQILMFPLGMIAGYYANITYKLTLWQIIAYFIVMLLLFIATKLISVSFICDIIRTLIGMPLICICFYVINDKKHFVWILTFFNWLGKYSLEIYLLHLLIYLSWFDVCPLTGAWQYITTVVISLILCKPIHNIIYKLQRSKFYLLKS